MYKSSSYTQLNFDTTKSLKSEWAKKRGCGTDSKITLMHLHLFVVSSIIIVRALFHLEWYYTHTLWLVSMTVFCLIIFPMSTDHPLLTDTVVHIYPFPILFPILLPRPTSCSHMAASGCLFVVSYLLVVITFTHVYWLYALYMEHWTL